MTTKDQQIESVQVPARDQEAGVADLLELYQRIENIYVQASASMSERELVYTSDSTNRAKPNAHLG